MFTTTIIRNSCLSFFLAVLIPLRVYAFEPFEVETIRVDGLQRISVGTVFNYLPVKVGDRFDDEVSSHAVRSLYKTGFFKDVVLEREGNALVVFVAERPAIASIEIEGNDDIPEDQLTANLKQLGLSEGRVLDRSLLDKVEQELKRQYLSLGKYNVNIRTEETPLERNRVAVRVEIYEGEAAVIQRLNIVGNTVFDEQTLLDEFESGTKPFFSLFDDSYKYSKQRLTGDLEALRSYYLDRGYINFNIDSTQVTITPDKEYVYITINITEGEQYTISEVKLAGELHFSEQEIRKQIEVSAGDIFSQRKVTQSANNISERLGDDGYAFANVNPVPDIDKENKKVALTFYVDPGKRAYVNRVNINGNIYTMDEVLRRELRQMEGGMISSAKIKRSRTRLDRLGYFQQVNVETPAVAGSPDMVDVNYDVVENDTFGSLNFGIGYGEAQGFTITAGVNQQNFFGTGNKFSTNVSHSAASTSVSASFTDPYYTMDGVSRGYHLFYSETDAGELQTTDYIMNRFGGGISFGVPLSEHDSVRTGIDYENIEIHTDSGSSENITGFCEQNAATDDCVFNVLKPSISWVHDTRNRAMFPTSGGQVSASLEVSSAVGEYPMDYYKLSLRQKHYFELTEKLTFSPRFQLGYGDSFGDTSELPPWERYFAGGMYTVRGYRINSLGPRDSYNDPIGGNLRLVGNIELFYVPPFAEKSKASRLSLFVDGGNVYDGSDFDSEELRYSAGIGFQWFTPVGPLMFSFAKALNEKTGDETEEFQFTMGTGF